MQPTQKWLEGGSIFLSRVRNPARRELPPSAAAVTPAPHVVDFASGQ
jgi:hypothetical protein